MMALVNRLCSQKVNWKISYPYIMVSRAPMHGSQVKCLFVECFFKFWKRLLLLLDNNIFIKPRNIQQVMGLVNRLCSPKFNWEISYPYNTVSHTLSHSVQVKYLFVECFFKILKKGCLCCLVTFVLNQILFNK